jgi:hypothetical protein
LYAPFYRQLGLQAEMNILNNGGLPVMDDLVARVPLVDLKEAFEFFLAHYNKGRPVIFASHSQGTIIMRQLLLWLKEAHPDVLARTVACYMVGFSINEEFCKSVGLPFAQGETDTGVIISYNSEAPGTPVNPLLVLPNPLAINPINWKRDDTYAAASESLGSRVRYDDAKPPVDEPHFADAQVNLERGSVMTNAALKAGSPWPDGVLHFYDYQLFYYDLQANVAKRIAAWRGK